MKAIIVTILMLILAPLQAVEQLITEAKGYQLGYIFCFVGDKNNKGANSHEML
jgi:hypothetical protein